jgi:starch phosphorylase
MAHANHYNNDPETRAALDLIAANHLSANEPGVFAPILDVLIRKGDHCLHLADLESYSEAHTRPGELYRDQASWSRKAVLNIAAPRKFSSDRTITEYARDIWHADPCPVD